MKIKRILEQSNRIGYDFYCDVANRIIEARQEMGITQGELAKKAKIKLSRLSGLENVKVRVSLEDLEKLSKVLERSVDWLACAEYDAHGDECLYTVSVEHCRDLEIYMRANSRQVAFLNFDAMMKNVGVKYDTPRERAFVKLVGIPVTEKEIKKKFKNRNGEEDLSLEKD